jgi:hypothetical protein
MGIQTLKENKKYRIFIEGLGQAGNRRQHTEVFYGTREAAQARQADLIKIRNIHPDFATLRWPKVSLPPGIYSVLLRLSSDVGESPEQFLIDIISSMAEDS